MLQPSSFKANNINPLLSHNPAIASPQSQTTIFNNPTVVRLPVVSATTENNELPHKKNTARMSLVTMKKMLIKFLFDKKMPKNILAESLGIRPIEIDRILATKISDELAHRVSLTLVKLYCKTRWN